MSMTAGTSEYPFREGHLLAMPTLAACLTRIGRVDFHQVTASFFRFARQLREKRRPRGIGNAFGKTMVLDHPVDRQIFHSNQAVGLDNLATFLVREVFALPCNSLMDASDGFAMFVAFCCAFGKFAVLALDFGKGFLFGAEKARIDDFLSVRESRKGLKPNINAHRIGVLRQPLRLYFTGEGGIPFAGAALVDSERLDFATHRAMVDHLDSAHLGEADPVIMGDAKPRLRKGEAVIAALASEARIPGVFSGLTAPEKGFKGQINPHGDILQDLRMHAFEGRAFVFKDRKGCLLLIERKGAPVLLPSIPARSQQVIIQPATLFKCRFQGIHLLFIGKESILKRLTHGGIIAQTRTGVEQQGHHPIQTALKGRPIHPRSKETGLSGPFSVKKKPGTRFLTYAFAPNVASEKAESGHV